MELLNLLYFSNKETINKLMPANNCVLEYVKKKDKNHFADFLYLASEA